MIAGKGIGSPQIRPRRQQARSSSELMFGPKSVGSFTKLGGTPWDYPPAGRSTGRLPGD